jgi:hypothetical protein
MHLVLATVCKMAGVCVIVRCARRGIQAHGLHARIRAPSNGLHGSHGLRGHVLDVSDVGCRRVLLVHVIADRSALPVVRAVQEVHVGVGRLVFVVAPAVQDIARRTVDIHEPADRGKAVVHGDVVLGL